MIPLATLLAGEYANLVRRAHTSAAFRMLGETLDNGDVELARQAIEEFKHSEGSPSVIMDHLSQN